MALTLRANLQLLFPSDSPHRQSAAAAISYPNSLPRNSTGPAPPPASFSTALSWMTISEKKEKQSKKRGSSSTVVAAVGDVSPDGTAYLFVGAAAVALLGTAFPVFFSRKDLMQVSRMRWSWVY
ncbi:uncharacterized protein LOC131159370 isoform X2 [Malania oleifera]|uniref:uncharacterized protein LOC131159370 isoform X2 n=1 Tax=Malania oleifera TaxID=397392 RepID=UPI0025ADF456|nr:uncharacterized protein LOC131159370 isoform X2 [Malania oleifera]